MNIRCIALDLDRTTLDKAGRLSPGNRAAIQGAISRGTEVVVASGRAWSSLPAEVTAIPGLRYAITSNGAAVCMAKTGEPLLRHRMRREAASAILDRIAGGTETGEIVCEAFVDGVPYCPEAYYAEPEHWGLTPEIARYVRKTRRPVPDIPAFVRAHPDGLDCLDLTILDDASRSALRAQLEREVPHIYITTSARHLLEISDEHGGKHNALRWLLKRLGIAPEETAAFGDGDNDADMLAFVGAGVAVGNAGPACRAAAAFVTDDHDRDGVARWLTAAGAV